MRRIVVAAMVFALVTAGAWGTWTLVRGGDDEGGRSASTAGSSSDSTDAGSSDTTEAESSDSTDDRGEDDPPAVPTREDKLRLFIVGDSLAGGLGPVLTDLVERTGVVEASTLFKVSSGLTRPDFYDWPAVLAEEVPDRDPDVIVAQFGGNDAQNIDVDGEKFYPGTPQFAAEYARRVGEVMDYLAGSGRRLIWVGLPNAESSDFRTRLAVVVGIQKAEAAKRPEVRYVDSWDIFTGADGGFAAYVRDPRDGEFKDVRASDEFHLNNTGESILAAYVGDEVLAEVRARGGET